MDTPLQRAWRRDSAEHIASQVRMRRALRIVRPRRRPPRQIPPTTVAVGYYADIRRLLHLAFREAQEVARRWVARGRLDSVHDDFDKLGDRYFRQVSAREVRAMAVRHAERASAHSAEQLRSQSRAMLGFDMLGHVRGPRGRAGLMDAFAQENASLIRSIPNKLFDEVERLTVEAVRKGDGWEALSARLEKRLGVAENSAKRVARDQVGKLYGDVQQALQTEMGVAGYIWRTSRDELVRGNPGGKYPNADPSHWEREGQRFLWAEPPEDGHPGQPINCRCFPEPDFSAILAEV